MTGTPASRSDHPQRLSGGWPVLGHAREFLKDPIALLSRARTEAGPVAEFRLGPQPAVLLSGPGPHQAFFHAPDTQVSQRAAYQLMIPVFGTGVVYDASPERMVEQFHFLIPALQQRRMRTYGALIAAEVREATQAWGDEGVIEAYPFTRTLVGHTSTRCLLGPEFRSELTAEFEAVYADLEGGVKPIAYLAPNLPIPAFRRRNRARRRLEDLVSRVVDQRLQSGQVHDDFLQTLMDAHYSDGSEPSRHEITGLLLAALFAGRDTSSATTAWALIELAQNRREQAVLRSEIAAAPWVGEVDEDFLRAIPAAEPIILEVLRLHPPLFMLLRRVLQPLDVDGYRVAPGNLIAVSPRVAHRDPSVFARPDTFDPARFGPDREEDKQPFAFIPFGGGQHRCMGTAFAMLQLKTILALILRDFELEALDDPVGEDYGILVVGPKPPARIRYKRLRPGRDGGRSGASPMLSTAFLGVGGD
jgi:sterol 14alpha-demethylase